MCQYVSIVCDEEGIAMCPKLKDQIISISFHIFVDTVIVFVAMFIKCLKLKVFQVELSLIIYLCTVRFFQCYN